MGSKKLSMHRPSYLFIISSMDLPLLFNSGRVFSFNNRLIYDPVTGKSRGFGFCEYEDAETAMSAVRNLAGREVNGRPLRIDSATNAPGGGGGGGGVGEMTRVSSNRQQGNVEVSELE